MKSRDALAHFGIGACVSGAWSGGKSLTGTPGATLISRSPIDATQLAAVASASEVQYEEILRRSTEAFLKWRLVPAPKRGELVRQIGNALRENKAMLGQLITLETGKILAEGEGEVQEAIDIADFAVGLSRQLYGLTMHSERPGHRMYEQWHPLGVCGVITAFNFPVAVWAWNAMLAAVCGDVVIWKPSELTPLCAIATQQICDHVLTAAGHPDVFSLIVADGPALGQRMAADVRIPLISATGSTRMGKSVGEVVAKRLGRAILELGGNNAVTILRDADLDMAVRSTLFGSVGTAGQRCTTTRRIIVESEIESEFTDRLVAAYKQVRIGDPLKRDTLMGPLIHRKAVEQFLAALEQVKQQGGKVIYGGEVLTQMPSELYVKPAIVKAARGMAITHQETFAPILYIIGVQNLEEAIAVNNEVPQGLSSALFTQSVFSAERFLAATGSDCGIANVNIGTSGAEIGGAFGGEKETGGGREAGSDSWRQYMRRQTSTINWSKDLPLAQGITFNV